MDSLKNRRCVMQIALGVAFKRAREKRGRTQEQLAEELHMHRTYYSAVERGEKNLTLTTMMKITGGLNCHLSELFTEAEYIVK